MSYAFKHPSKASTGHKVSHAKNKTKRTYKYNLQTVTVVVDGVKQRLKVPARVLKMLKKSGVTTHYKPENA